MVAEIYLAMCIQARVVGPHTGELLAHCTQGLLHSSRSDAFTAGRQCSDPVGHFVSISFDVGID